MHRTLIALVDIISKIGSQYIIKLLEINIYKNQRCIKSKFNIVINYSHLVVKFIPSLHLRSWPLFLTQNIWNHPNFELQF